MRFASSAALSSTREKAAETVGCCCIPWTDGFAFSAASACARNSAASGTSCCGSSWSSNARSRCSGYSSGLPIRRASSCAAATASWLLSVSLLKSMSPVDCPSHFRHHVRHRDVVHGTRSACRASPPRTATLRRAGQMQRLMSDTWAWPSGTCRKEVDGWLPRPEVATVLAVNLVDRRTHLTLHAVQPALHPLHLVLQLQYLLHPCEIEAELVHQLRDQLQPLDVCFRIQTRVAGRALRADQTLVLVDAQRLRMHADNVGRDGDHVARAVVHHAPTPSSGRRESGTLPSSSVNPYSAANSAATSVSPVRSINPGSAARAATALPTNSGDSELLRSM